MVKDRTTGAKVFNVILYFLMFLAAALSLIPIINTIAISFSSGPAASSGKVAFWPIEFTVESYRKIMNDTAFWRAFMVSVGRVVVGSTVSLTLTILMAFPMSRNEKQFAARNIYMWYLLVAMLFGGGLIPTYMVVYKVGLINSFWALILPGAVGIGNIVLMMNFFRNLPTSLEEAAIIDGAKPMQILLQILLPISIPSLATIALFTIVGNWNDFFSGLIYINDQNKIPLQTYLQQLSIQAQNLSNMTPEEIADFQKVSSMSLNSAKILVSMVPILIIYPLLQKFLVKGLVIGAVKE